ncbi:hypothetical protein EJ02DRAFT_457489 [Clathrospora elynae]|uniref:Extracellular membrane protein CFEM domain-containing protein n=1 Tax=Clathrospora elynae TaxID=706981 RepID=A0A6A5SH37_9PLEO|nr:hypothetical protein EJ02DRAFT_457489 [Clathrospora elynae]
MFTNLLIFVALLGFTAAASIPSTPGECEPGAYRCDPSLTSIEACDLQGWHLAASCHSASCVMNVLDGVPRCHDH